MHSYFLLTEIELKGFPGCILMRSEQRVLQSNQIGLSDCLNNRVSQRNIGGVFDY